MEEAAFTMLSVSLSATLWALLGGLAWIVLFYSALPVMAKWNTADLMSSEAAARAATVRTLATLRATSPAPRDWSE